MFSINQFLEANGFGDLPVCIGKTQVSISHDTKLRGAASSYIFPINDAGISTGAGFICARAGEISLRPGLPTRPAFFEITVDAQTGQLDS